MTFSQIERIIGAKLPASAQQYRAWWSNNPNNSVMTRAWLDAGFRSERVDMARRKLTFRKLEATSSTSAADVSKRPAISKRHPLYGWMKGTVTIAPGVDLTEPADPHWGEVAYGDKTWHDFSERRSSVIARYLRRDLDCQ